MCYLDNSKVNYPAMNFPDLSTTSFGRIGHDSSFLDKWANGAFDLQMAMIIPFMYPRMLDSSIDKPLPDGEICFLNSLCLFLIYKNTQLDKSFETFFVFISWYFIFSLIVLMLPNKVLLIKCDKVNRILSLFPQ